MTASKLSLAVAAQAATNKLDELDELQTSQREQLEGLRDAFINYIAVSEQIIKELADGK